MNKSTANLSICLMLLVFVSLGCLGMRKPWRDYSDKSFNSQAWLAGDAIERGRMIKELFSDPQIKGLSPEGVKKLLGEPDKKTTIENREVWLYRVDLGHNQALPYFPISFDDKKGAFAGSIKGDTMSLLVDE